MTMTEIARQSGVSLKTVSRVVNHPEKVSKDTRAKVEKAMEELGYEVNLLAKALKEKRTNIVVVFLDPHNGEYLNSWRNEVLRYLFRYASEIGMKLVISASDSRKFEGDQTDGFYLLSNGIADGAILLEYIEKDKRVEYLKKKHAPFVILGQPREKDLFAVSLDNYDVGYQGAKLFGAAPYRKLALFTGSWERYSPSLRAEGFETGIRETGKEGVVYYGISTMQEAFETAGELFQKGLADCVMVPGDERALGVYRAASELGRRIPEDVGVIAMDDLPMCACLNPPLTALRHDLKGIAGACIDMLDAQLRENVPNFRQKFFPTHLADRSSLTLG